jgi:hypothetical protein
LIFFKFWKDAVVIKRKLDRLNKLFFQDMEKQIDGLEEEIKIYEKKNKI